MQLTSFYQTCKSGVPAFRGRWGFLLCPDFLPSWSPYWGIKGGPSALSSSSPSSSFSIPIPQQYLLLWLLSDSKDTSLPQTTIKPSIHLDHYTHFSIDNLALHLLLYPIHHKPTCLPQELSTSPPCLRCPSMCQANLCINQNQHMAQSISALPSHHQALGLASIPPQYLL